jgi:hypothetical protein
MSRVLESGDVYFLYRPRVDVREVRGLEDVQRFFVVLALAGRAWFRRLVVGRKRLPDLRTHERGWAFVAEVADDPEAFRDDVQRFAYQTRTRGPRIQPGARLAGEGRYALVDHDGHTHLAYVLAEPPLEQARRMFLLAGEASYIIAVRNPDAPAPPGTGLPPQRRPDYPDELLARFRGRRFSAADPPELLDHVGAEIVLIGAAEDAESELGIELDPGAEELRDAELLRELRLRPAPGEAFRSVR